MIICGIDPGKTGGVAFLDPDARVLVVHPMPDISTYADMLDFHHPYHVFIEKAQSMPKQGIVSAFNYGTHFGELGGVLIAMKIPFTLVHPSTWTRVLHTGTRGAEKKSKSLQAAQRIFPGESWLPPETKCRNPQSGMFEAALIAEWGWRFLASTNKASA